MNLLPVLSKGLSYSYTALEDSTSFWWTFVIAHFFHRSVKLQQFNSRNSLGI